MKKKLFIIDAMAMAFRNFHAFGQRPLQTKSGIPTSAVFGSAQFMLKLLEDEKPDFLVVATDSKEKTFRHDIYSEYKANRKDMPEDLAAQLPYFFELFEAMKIPVLKQPGMEADDLIGSLVTSHASDELQCFIVSGDKDFMQLVNPNVFLYQPKKNEPAQFISFDGVFEKFGCTPSQVIDMLAIIGDTSDNVPGVHGIGDKGAAKLIKEFGSLQNIYDNLDKISNPRLKNALESSRDKAFLAQKLVTIKTDIPISTPLESMATDIKQAQANQHLLDLFSRMEFRSLASKTAIALGKPLNSFPENMQSANTNVAGTLNSKHSEVSDAQKALGSAINQELQQSTAATTKETPSQEKFGVTYRLCDSPELLMSCAQELHSAQLFSFDTETTGLDRIVDTMIGISVSTKEGTGWYIPLIEKHLKGWLTSDLIKETLEPIFMDSSKTKVAHNLKFDLQMFSNSNWKITGPFGDTMMQSYLLSPQGRDHSLDTCSFEVFQFKKIPTSALMGEKYSIKMEDVDLNLLATYSCEDADFVYRLNKEYTSRLDNEKLTHVYQNIEVPLIPILCRMERAGIYIDTDSLGIISNKLDQRAKELEEIIYREAGESFNINSPKQLQVILFEKLAIHEKLGIKRLKKTKSGFSTDVTVLESMEDHPLPRAILEYRMVSKLKSTYVDALPQLVHPRTNRIHTSFHQTGTTTGRLSSSDPNLQNIPIRRPEGREIRRAFCASSHDRVIVSADYSQVELRLLAHISGDEGLAEAFSTGQDIHTATAMKIFGVTKDQVTADLRSNAKAINFGIIYGMGPQRLARDTGVSMAEAKSFIDKYFLGFPKIKSYIEQAKRSAHQLGYSMTITGRKRPIPELQSKERAVIVNGENMAVNSPIQGSAADLVKFAMLAVQKRLDESSLDAKMLLQVHDELVFECLGTDAEKLKALVKESMETAMILSVPLKVEVGSGYSWVDAH
ncbi:MAG: DNA polymerase I [Proteobacteria bacterium]|nr:DNA polymerase I [Pseudomonadota bacterium]